MRWACCLMLALALARPCAATDAPAPRPLEQEPPAAPAPGGEEPSRTLPPSVAVCLDPGGARCWTRALAEQCGQDGGKVFRVVPGDAKGRDAVAALTQCRAAAAAPRRAQ
jgi:hypothetical protein